MMVVMGVFWHVCTLLRSTPGRVIVLITKLVEVKLNKMLVMMLHKVAQRSLSSVQTG